MSAEGVFEHDRITIWQHVLMYASFCVSGAVDLIALHADLPQRTAHVSALSVLIVPGFRS